MLAICFVRVFEWSPVYHVGVSIILAFKLAEHTLSLNMPEFTVHKYDRSSLVLSGGSRYLKRGVPP